MEIKIPKCFFDDHTERELPTPEVLRPTKTHYWINPNDPALPELIDDAKYYSDKYGPDACGAGLKLAAKALLKALGVTR